MKDYSMNSSEARKYILSYEIKKDKLIANLANGEIYSVPYTKENEQRIIEIMENQAKKAKVKPLKKRDNILLALEALVLPFSIIGYISNSEWYVGIAIGLIGSTALYYTGKIVSNKIKKKDIKKLTYFLENKEELNEEIKKSENITLGISKKAKNQINIERNKQNKPFNINNIDSYSLNDLKTIRDNFERTTYFNLEEPQPEIRHVLTRKKHGNIR